MDGPAGSGKGRIAKYIANKWKFFHLDSGLLYRCFAYELLKNNISIYNEKDISDFIKDLKKLSSKNHKNVRTEKISKITSKLAEIAKLSQMYIFRQIPIEMEVIL